MKLMRLFEIQLFSSDNTWSNRCNVPKTDRYSNTQTQWTKLSLYFILENYGIKLLFDEIDSAHFDMFFGNISKLLSVQKLDQVIHFADLVESIPD